MNLSDPSFVGEHSVEERVDFFNSSLVDKAYGFVSDKGEDKVLQEMSVQIVRNQLVIFAFQPGIGYFNKGR